jgi:outer membrane murein-binding lipoprotein Lpp
MASKKPKTKPSKPTKTAPTRKAAPVADVGKRLATLADEVDQLSLAVDTLRGEVEELADDNDNLRERVDALEDEALKSAARAEIARRAAAKG